MSELRDRAKEKIAKKIFIQKGKEETWDDLVPEIKAFWLQDADELLTLLEPELAIVDRNTKPPTLRDESHSDEYVDGHIRARKDMVKKGWVKEIMNVAN